MREFYVSRFTFYVSLFHFPKGYSYGGVKGCQFSDDWQPFVFIEHY